MGRSVKVKHLRCSERHNSWTSCVINLHHWQRYWLTLPGSLTMALHTLGRFSLKVGKEGTERLWGDEAEILGIHPGNKAWIREVMLMTDGTPRVYARSFTTLKASRGSWRGLRYCGQQPLGHLLYHSAHIQRGAFEWCRCHPESPLGRIPQAIPLPNDHDQSILANGTPQLARRSLFIREGAPLCVSESFDPSMWNLAREDRLLGLPPRWSPSERFAVAR